MEQFESEWHAWHDERLAALATPFGFLSVTGLHWLEEGANTWDSAPGVFERRGSLIRFLVEPGRSVGPTAATMDAQREAAEREARQQESQGQDARPGAAGEPVAEFGREADGTPWMRVLAPGCSHPWLLAGHTVFEVIERDGRLGVRIRSSRSALLQNFVEVPTFPLDVAWTVTGTFTPFPEPRTVRIATALPGLEADAVTVGEVSFELGGHTHRLTVTGSPQTGLRADFHDYTNGESTPSWRTLSLGVPDAAGKVILDFNRAVVYPFAFLPWATCPAPVPENILPLAVTAGELKPLRTIGESGINHPVGIIDLSRGFDMPEALAWLEEAGADVIRFRVHAGVPMPGPIAADAFIVAGVTGADDHAGEEVVAQVREFAEDALAVGTPMVGIGSSGAALLRRAALTCDGTETAAGAGGVHGPADGAGANGRGRGTSPSLVVSPDLAGDRLLRPYVRRDEATGLGIIEVDVLAEAANGTSARSRGERGSGEPVQDRRRVWFELIDRFARLVLTR
ncbi:DUF1684 domain-containing protein [Brevibacterium salitolerans]|uniref:DUF1684 domain-containing protein n=1 Tax=Brevibacterium salitolerans TaxID=1403566 RepID=A0ABN2WRQ8_9MICO